MNSNHRFGIAAAVVAVAAVVSIITVPDLPESVVIHWNAAGEPDGTMAKPLALSLVPVLSGVLLGTFAVLPRIDPLGENIASFRAAYDWFVVGFTVFMTVLHGGIIVFNLGYEFDFVLFALAGAAPLMYAVGVLLTRAERNWFVGIRTPWTLSSDEVWDRTNDLGGRLFKLTALVALVGLLFEDYAIYFLVVPALLTAGITLVYSYYLYGRIEDRSGATPGSKT